MTATPDPAAIVDLIVMLERRAARVESFQQYRRAGRLRRHAEAFRTELEATET